MATDLLRERLPEGCHLGVTQDGRVFFIDDHQQTTSWLHPTTGQPILTGLHFSKDLPQGWEQDFTNEGQVYFVDHNRQLTTFDHPVYGTTVHPQFSLPHSSDLSPSSFSQSPASPQGPRSPLQQRENFNYERKQRSVKAPSAKRNPDSEIVKRGWLYRLESSGISKSKSWKRRWCVLADFALFVYKSDDEVVTLTSILLPSYRVNPCTEADNIRRNFVFKIEHENTKTLYFATDESSECMSWMALIRQAAVMNGNVGFQREPNNNIRQHPIKAVNRSPVVDRHPLDVMDNAHNDGQNWDSSSYHKDASPADQLYHKGRLPADVKGNLNNPSSARHSYSSQSPSYKGYGDPAASPLATPADHNFPQRYGNPVYSDSGHTQERHSYRSYDGSTLSNRGPQAFSSGREQSFQSNRVEDSRSFHGDSTADPRLQLSHQQQPLQEQQLRDGFAPDSTRNSLAQSDSSRFGSLAYSPAQAEQQRLQHELEKNSLGSKANADHRRGDTQRGSFSDINDNQVKQLHRWDKNFPSLDSEHLKHGSYDDLLDGGKGRNNDTFNTRSKSHDNFSRFPESYYQQEQQQNPGGGHPHHYFRQESAGAENGQFWPQTGDSSIPDTKRQAHTVQGGLSLSPSSLQGSLPQYHPHYQSQRGHQGPYQQERYPRGIPSRDRYAAGDTRNPTCLQPPYQQQQLHQDRRSYVSTSSAGEQNNSSFRDPTNHFSSPQKFPSTQQQQAYYRIPPQQQHPESSVVQSQQPHGKADLHLNLSSDSSTLQGSHSISHTYVNFPSRAHQQFQHTVNDSHDISGSPPPGRPPYPAAVRQQIVEEMAQTKTPSTQKDFIASAQMNMQRMQQPSYFQYPSPRDQQPFEQSSKSHTRSQHPSQASLDHPRNQPSSHSTSANRASQLPHGDQKGSSRSQQDSFKSTSMMDPEAQKLRLAYERVHSLRMAPDRAPPKRKSAPIQTVKEDPNMSDREVLETNLQKIVKKNPLSGPRLRMSISAGDLIGKTHDELVLLLIQLRRNQAALEKTRDIYRTQIEQRKPAELEYKRQIHQFGEVRDKSLFDQHQNFLEAKYQMEEIDNKLEVYKPIINLLGNMVTMGSLYGGDNLMLATQYRKHLLRPDQYQPPKKMLEFSRKHQEDRLIQETEEEIKQLSSAEVDLEEKIDRLNELEHRLQQQSLIVSGLKEEKELMEKALAGVQRQQDHHSNDPREMRRLTQQQRTYEKEISRVTQQLAEASKELEETTAENNKLEHEIALLRTKVHGELNRSRSAPSLASENVRTKMKIEKEVAKVDGIMQGLSREGARLSQAMNTIRRSSSSSQLASALDKEDGKKLEGTYLQTDLDSGDQVDLAGSWERTPLEEDNSRPVINHQRQNANSSEDWDMEGADENTKRFFGLMPKDKPKGLTVRDVKRQSEQRKEREKIRKDGDDFDNGEEIKLQVSSVDNEASSIIHARIPSNGSGPSSGSAQSESSHPLYENLVRYGSFAPGILESQSAPGSRRSSLILMAPKPFTPYQDKSVRPFRSELALNASGGPHFDAGLARQDSEPMQKAGDPPLSAEHIARPGLQSSQAYSAHSWNKLDADLNNETYSIKRNPRGRYLTISSSEPIKLESNSLMNRTLHGASGDLILNKSTDDVPDIVKSSQTRSDQIDEDTIEKEILYLPEKVLIPERYDPEADAEQLTEEEKARRREKAEKIKRVLTSQSVLSMSQPDVSQLGTKDIHFHVQQEKRERFHYLTLNQELARQVTLQSKKQAAERRKTWSGAQFADAKRQYEDEQLAALT